MIIFVELKGIDCSLVVDADENAGPRGDGSGEESCGSFLHSMKFGIKDLSPITEMAAPIFYSEELLVSNIENYPAASSRLTV